MTLSPSEIGARWVEYRAGRVIHRYGESLAHGADWVRTLFKDRTPEVEAALRRLESALVDLKRRFRAEVASRLAAEPELETRLFELTSAVDMQANY